MRKGGRNIMSGRIREVVIYEGMLVSPRCITVLSLTTLLLVGKIKWRRFTMRSALLLCTYYVHSSIVGI